MSQDAPKYSQQIQESRTILADNIERLAREQGLSWSEVEEKTQVSRMHLYRIRTSKKAATVDTITKIACAFGVESYDLLKPPGQ